MKKFRVMILTENVEGTTLQRRVAYNISYGEEIIYNPESIICSSYLLQYINHKLNKEYPYLELIPEDPDYKYGLPNTILQTVDGIEPAMAIEVYPEEEIDLFVYDKEDEFKHKFKILQKYLKNFNQALETILGKITK